MRPVAGDLVVRRVHHPPPLDDGVIQEVVFDQLDVHDGNLDAGLPERRRRVTLFDFPLLQSAHPAADQDGFAEGHVETLVLGDDLN